MFIIILTYKKPLSDVNAHIPAHRVFLDEGYKNNVFIASGPKVPRTGGVIISHLQNRADVEALIKQDPFYQHEVADYEIIEFGPNKCHPDFEGFVS
ncbi:MAG: YciI family protein [Gammaproteobacteria bacterium]|nr:YciI family protein [Gammaproteobacteria bacterium]